MTAVRRRLDSELVRRCIAPSRTAAAALIDEGRVHVGGAIASKSSRLVAPSEAVYLSGEPQRFVSRGGYKLDAALDAFGIDVEDRRALDAGASTGGFVDCLLQRGAGEVIAVDVGWGQLDARLRADERVIVRERCNIRDLGAQDIGSEVDIVTADLSFISLRTVMPNLAACAKPTSEAVLLVKPQFEAGKREASRGKGVVRDPAVWRRVLDDVVVSASEHGLGPAGITISPLRGAAGNVEFLLFCRRRAEVAVAATLRDADVADVVRLAADETEATRRQP
ncbi:TlyA family RNA methyltransferase [Candidatus Poriferisodalis sp.]|uniref:TlyA family RNA methyltransferase n=1 Tax=Candidatus Poriferisodalis sp. TaxID=3101277 RepID=UPI003B015456